MLLTLLVGIQAHAFVVNFPHGNKTYHTNFKSVTHGALSEAAALAAMRKVESTVLNKGNLSPSVGVYQHFDNVRTGIQDGYSWVVARYKHNNKPYQFLCGSSPMTEINLREMVEALLYAYGAKQQIMQEALTRIEQTKQEEIRQHQETIRQQEENIRILQEQQDEERRQHEALSDRKDRALQHLQGEFNRTQEALTQKDGKIRTISTNLNDTNQKLNDTKQALQETQEELDNKIQKLAESQQELADKKAELAQITAQKARFEEDALLIHNLIVAMANASPTYIEDTIEDNGPHALAVRSNEDMFLFVIDALIKKILMPPAMKKALYSHSTALEASFPGLQPQLRKLITAYREDPHAFSLETVHAYLDNQIIHTLPSTTAKSNDGSVSPNGGRIGLSPASSVGEGPYTAYSNTNDPRPYDDPIDVD